MKVQQALKAWVLNRRGNQSMNYCRQSTLGRTSYWYYCKLGVLEIRNSEKRIFASTPFSQGKHRSLISLCSQCKDCCGCLWKEQCSGLKNQCFALSHLNSLLLFYFCLCLTGSFWRTVKVLALALCLWIQSWRIFWKMKCFCKINLSALGYCFTSFLHERIMTCPNCRHEAVWK